DRENDGRRDPGGNARGQRPLPDKEEAEDNDGNARENVAEKEDVEHAARVLPKHADEFLQRWVFFLEPAELMRLECKKRGLESGQKRRPKNEERDEKTET